MANDRRRRSPNDRPRWLPNQQASQRADDRKYLLIPIGALEIENLLLLLHDPAVLGEDTVGEPDDELPERVGEAWEPAPCEHLNGGLSGFKNRCGGALADLHSFSAVMTRRPMKREHDTSPKTPRSATLGSCI